MTSCKNRTKLVFTEWIPELTIELKFKLHSKRQYFWYLPVPDSAHSGQQTIFIELNFNFIFYVKHLNHM